MSLPDLTAVKAYLRIENSVEDTTLTAFLASALAFVTEFTGRPVTAVDKTLSVEAPANWDGCAALTSFFLPLYPVSDVTLTDADDVAVDTDDYRVIGATGKVIALNGTSFSNFPYAAAVTVGLSLMDDYATRVEPKLYQAMLDLCADWYQRRNPGALAEGAGGGVITQWQTLGVPERICEQLKPYRLSKAY